MAYVSLKRIDQVHIGDRVKTRNPITGKTSSHPVAATWVHSDTLVTATFIATRHEAHASGRHARVGDEDEPASRSNGPGITQIVTTEDHPFWNATVGAYEELREFAIGDTVSGVGGQEYVLFKLSAVSEAANVAYNLTVSSSHSYLVGPGYILVHNDGDSRLARPGYSNYTLSDSNGVYYSGMFGPNSSRAGVERRHSRTGNRYSPGNGDMIQVVPGSRSYGEARLMEQTLAEANGTVIGRDGANQRGNRQNPLASSKREKYENYVSNRCG
jgi:hypothetical protein